MTDTLPPLPLSDEQINELAVSCWHYSPYAGNDGRDFDHREFARAILRAALPAAQPVAWLRHDGMKAMPADEREAYEQGIDWLSTLIVAEYTIPLYAAPVAAETLASGVQPPQAPSITDEELTRCFTRCAYPGPNPMYRCNACGAEEFGVRNLLVEHALACSVLATDPPTGTPSDARGAWTCSRCGFRGFWSGGPHECASGVSGMDSSTLSRHTPLKG
jgi:hypothetical protein